jgi:hypothetical protein
MENLLQKHNESEKGAGQSAIGQRESSPLIIGGSLRRFAERDLAGNHGGSGIEEAEQLAAPVSAVQLVFASIGAPGNR